MAASGNGAALAMGFAPPPKAMVEAPGEVDKTKRKVRAVGPTFLPAH